MTCLCTELNVFQIFGGIQHSVAMRSRCCNRCRIAAHRWCFLIRSTARPSTDSAYGNEGARQKGRALLPAMTSDYIDACCREAARVLRPSGYLLQWADTFRVCEAYHKRIADVLECVDLIVWDSQRMGNGYRSRRRGGFLLVLQRPPLAAKSTWHDHSIPDRWPEKVDRKVHPHIKPIGLIRKLIGAVTRPGDLVVDPAAGSFVVMHAARQRGCDFVGCDLAYDSNQPHLHGEMNEYLSRHSRSVRGAPVLAVTRS